jgi:hypothetical protein
MTAGTPYTREQLAEAAKTCRDIDEVIAFLGTKTYTNLRRHLYKRFDHFEIDISHFSRRRANRRHMQPTQTDVEQAVSRSTSVAGALKALQLPVTSRPRALFHEWVQSYGIDTSHFLGQAHQRGRPGPVPRKEAAGTLVKHNGPRRTKSEVLRRCLREIGAAEECAGCGTGPVWFGRSMTLEVDHINGDCHDDRVENLRLLCPNCHAITTTWCRGGKLRESQPRQ